jgi:hypothetical protein
MKQEIAETGAVRVLGWLAGEEDLLPVFLGATGRALRICAFGRPTRSFLASLLDFVLMDDAWVLRCAEALGLPPGDLGACVRRFPGARCRTGPDGG